VSASTVLCEGIRKAFGRSSRPSLDDVTVRAEAGRVLVLLGSSGSGKTTLLRIVAGLETADAGRVLVGDRVVSDPARRVPPEQRGVGMVFQDLELWPHMSVAENVAFGLPGRPRGRAARRHPKVADLAERVGIDALLDRRPPSLSGGERQRVAIARALAPDPGVLLYDEPLANLDPDRRADLRSLIRRLARERGATLVYVTHDAEEALEMGDEIAVLSAGRVVDRGTPESLYRAPSTIEGARALGPVTALAGQVEGDSIVTRLGRLRVVAVAPGADHAVLRPEDVETGEAGAAAVVVDSRPRGRDWSFVARLDGPDGSDVIGRSPSRLAPGATVRLAVRSPVAAVVAAGRAKGGSL
jgi:iron(III) transport system ATP-binding protein